MLRLTTPSQPNPIYSRPFSNVRISESNLSSDIPRILILYSGILMDDMIATMLCDEPDLEILITELDKEEVIAQKIISEKPQTVILCKSSWFSVDRLNQILEELHYFGTVQIVAVSLTENSLEVNHKKKLVTTNFKSFIQLVKNNGFAIQ